MKFITQLVILLLVLVILRVDGYSCSCANSSLKERLGMSDIAFVGKVLSVKCSDASCYQNVITLKADRYWKGNIKSEMKVLTRKPDGANCGLFANKGDTILVFANKAEENKFETNSCSSVGLRKKFIEKQTKELGKGKPVK